MAGSICYVAPLSPYPWMRLVHMTRDTCGCVFFALCANMFYRPLQMALIW